MKIKRTLFILCASCGLVIPGLQAADYSQSFSGGVRVQSTVVDSDRADPNDPTGRVDPPGGDNDPPGNDVVSIETRSTDFGGEEEESSTGGDTYLQWNHAFESDDGNTKGTGFLRFSANGGLRYNVQTESALGNYAASLKAEWETPDGFSGAISGRDQFAVIRHTPTGLYYKIGREEWLNNEKGYTTDFLSQSKAYSSNDGDARFSLHAIGWSGAGADIAILIQRDVIADPSRVDGSLFGIAADLNRNASHNAVPVIDNQVTDVDAFGLSVAYAAGPVDAKLIFLSGTQNNNEDRAVDGAAKLEGSGSTTQLNLAFPLSRATPFINFGTHTRTIEVGGLENVAYTRTGWNLGASLNFGPSDLVLAYGTLATDDTAKDTAREVANRDAGTATSGFDIMWATNQDPMKLSLAFSSQTQTFNDDRADRATAQYGVRLDYGF